MLFVYLFAFQFCSTSECVNNIREINVNTNIAALWFVYRFLKEEMYSFPYGTYS